MNRDPDERGHSDGAAPDEFDAIVSAWRREGEVPEWPEDVDPVADRGSGGSAAALFEPAPEAPVTPPPAAPRAARPDPEPAADDDHFIPPEPPPLPRLGPPALVGLGLIAFGLVLLMAPGWIVPDPYGLPLGLVALASGLGWLVLRLWPDPSSSGGDGDDDGAVL